MPKPPYAGCSLQVAANLLAMFCKESKGEYTQYIQQLFRCVIQLMNDVDEEVYTGGWCALDALVKVCGQTFCHITLVYLKSV